MVGEKYFARRGANGTDMYSATTLLLDRRMVFLTGMVDAELAEDIVKQLMVLDEKSHEPITLMIDSPGGEVPAGLGIIDCMEGIASPVRTYAYGMAASMTAVILACGESGYRNASNMADILVHQPLSAGLAGQVTDIAIAADYLVAKKQQLARLMASHMGTSIERVEAMLERDTHLTADEALKAGIVDKVASNWLFSEGDGINE